jgi:hypothetical protein
MRPGSSEPLDPDAIKELTPVDDYQLTKMYGEKRPFRNWELPEVAAKKPGDRNRTFSGYMQQMFCKYRTQDGRVVWGEYWAMNVSGRGSMNDNVAPGYKLEYDRQIGSYSPKVVPIHTDQFSQFFPTE